MARAINAQRWLAQRWLGLGILCLALASPGCGGGLASVSGKVVFPDKTPVTVGNVVFSPADSGKHAAQGMIQSDGTFRLGTNRAGDGAHPGKYRVAIEPPDDKAGILFDRRFENANKSGLEFTVNNGSNDFTIVVEKPKTIKKTK